MQKGLAVKLGRGAVEQFELVLRLRELGAKALGGLGVVQAGQNFVVAAGLVFTGAENAHAFFAAVVHAMKQLAHANRPGERHHRHAEFLLDLVHHAHGVLHLAVHLVHKGQDGRVAGAANLQEAARLRLDAVGRINHHQRGVHGGEHAVSVFREVLVAWCVQQVDHAVAVFHLHDRRGHRDTALLFNFHPVAGGVARGLARLDRAGDLDRAGEQQQLFSQRGLAGVRVGDDGKRAAALDLFFDFGGVGHNPRLSVTRLQAVAGRRLLSPADAQNVAGARRLSPLLH